MLNHFERKQSNKLFCMHNAYEFEHNLTSDGTIEIWFAKAKLSELRKYFRELMLLLLSSI